MNVSLGSGGPQTISSNNPAQTLSPTLNRFPSNPVPKKKVPQSGKIKGFQEQKAQQSSMKNLNKFQNNHVKSLSQPMMNTIQTTSSNQPSQQLFQPDQRPIQELGPLEAFDDTIYIKFNAVVSGVNDPTDFVIEIETAEFKDRLQSNGQDIKKTIGEYVHEDYQGYCSIEEYRVVSIKRKKNGMLCEVKKQDKINMLMESTIKFLVFFQLKPQQPNTVQAEPSVSKTQSQISNLSASMNAISSPDLFKIMSLEQKLSDNSKLYENFQKMVSQELNEQEKRLTQKLDAVQKSISYPGQSQTDGNLSYLGLSHQNYEQKRNKGKISFGKFPTNPSMDIRGIQNIQIQDASSGEDMSRQQSMKKEYIENSHMSFNPNASNAIMGVRQRDSIKSTDVKFNQMTYGSNLGKRFHQSIQNQPAIFQYESADPLKQLDLVFLYSDPLVSVKGGIHGCDQPLDLEQEYKSLVKSLQKTGKQFTMMREAISIQSMSSIIEKMPQIIHISSHGAFDPLKKEFFLAIENRDEAGQEYQIQQSDLETLLQPQKDSYSPINNIKMAFVSACQSEEIGEIFLKSGVPVVVSVNSDQEIMDEVCRVFSSSFYEYILAGNTIQGSFKKAQNLVEVHPKRYEVCCCAHKHTDDCEWYKFYKEDPKAAHAMHANKTCYCPDKKKRKHKQSCPEYKSFKNKFDSLYNKKKSDTQKPENEQNLISTQTKNMKDLIASVTKDDDSDLMLDDYSDLDVEPMIAQNDIEDQECIMCCCQPDLPHNESIKFQLKVADPSRREELLNQPIFTKQPGQLNNLDDRITNLMKIKVHVDSLMIYGRNIDIYKVVQFLSKGSIKRIMTITGIQGSGCDLIARQAIKYVIQRNFFNHGSFQIDATDSLTLEGLFQKIKKKMNLLVEDADEMFEELKNFELIILIEIGRQISSKETEDIQESMSKLIKNTDNLKIVLVVEQDTPLTFKQVQSQKLKTPIEVLEIKALDPIDAANMMFDLNRDNNKFMEEFPTVKELHKHKIFEIALMPEQISIISSLMQQESQSLDEAYNQQIHNQHQDQSQESRASNFEFNKNKINQIFYQKIIDLYPKEINILYILCFSQQGLADFDLKRITLAQLNSINQRDFQFGNWEDFLMQFIPQELDQMESAKDDSTVAQAESMQLSMQKINSKIITKMAQKQDSASPLKKMSTRKLLDDQNKFKKLESEIQQIQRKTNYCFVRKIKKEQAQEVSLYQIQPSFRSFILERTEMTVNQKQRFQFQYIKYMSILSRQLMRSIKYQKVQDFDPYLVSSQIDDGIWSEPHGLSIEMMFQDEANEQYSKQWPIENAVHYFQTHEANYLKFFDTNELQRIIQLMKDSQGSQNIGDLIKKTIENLDEILINVPSIFIMLNRHTEAEQLISNIWTISDIEDLKTTSAKVMLIQASIHLFFQPDNVVSQNLNRAKQIFKQSGNPMALGEILYLECISDVKSFIKSQLDGNGPRRGSMKLAKFRNMKSISMDEELGNFIDQNEINSNKELMRIDEEEEDDKISKQPRKSMVVQSPSKLKIGNQNSSGSQKSFLKNIEQIIQKLGHCRHLLHQGGQDAKICLARTWVLQADIVIDKLKNHQNIQEILFEKMPSTNLEAIFKHLQEASDMETIDNCEQLSTRCVLFMAKIRQKEENFVASNKLIHECLRDSQQFGLPVIQNEAKKIADEISAQLSKDSKNVFLFAKSCPIIDDNKGKGQKYLNQVFHQGIHDDSEQLLTYFQSKAKENQRQLNIKIDILNERFLRNVSTNGCRLLHISPYLMGIDNYQSQQMVIETDTFEKQVINPQQLKQLLQPQYRQLAVYFVLIDMPNCEQFAQVFQDLGVAHVISFKCQPSWNKDVIDADDNKQIEQSKLNLFVSFMNKFSKILYPMINENKPIQESIENAKAELLKKGSHYKELGIDVVHNCIKKGYKNDLLHELDQSTGSGNSSDIKEICDISEIRGSIDFQIDSKPFILREFTKFKELASSITFKSETKKSQTLQIPVSKSQSSESINTKKINVYGQRGVGKTKLVQHVANYLRFRFKFGAGVHYFDLAKTKNIDTLAQLFKRKQTKTLATEKKRERLKKTQLNLQESPATQNNPKNQKQEEFAEQQVLFIFDNCDDFIKKNTVSFLANLNYIQKQFSQMAVILISEKVLYQEDNQFNRIQLEPLKNYSAKLLFQTVIQSMNKMNQEVDWKEAMVEASDLIQISNGNAQLLSILALIFSYGGPILLKKVKIKSMESMDGFKRDLNNDEQSSQAIDQEQEQQCIHVIDTYYRQKTDSSSNTNMMSPCLPGNIKFSNTSRFNASIGKSFNSRGMMQRHQQNMPNFNSSLKKQFHKTSLVAVAEEKQFPFMQGDLQGPREKANKEFHNQLDNMLQMDQIQEKNHSNSEQDMSEQDSRDMSDQDSEENFKKKSSEKSEVEGAPAAYQNFGLTISKNFGGFGDLKGKGYDFQEAQAQPDQQKQPKKVQIIEEEISKSASLPSNQSKSISSQAMKMIDIKSQLSSVQEQKDKSPDILSAERSHASELGQQTPQQIARFQSNTDLDYHITNHEQYTTKYKSFCLEATDYNRKKLKIVIDTEKQVMIVFGPKQEANQTLASKVNAYRRRATISCSVCPSLSENQALNHSCRRNSRVSARADELQDIIQHLKPLQENQIQTIQEIKIFTPISTQLVTDDSDNVFKRPFARGLSKRLDTAQSGSDFESMNNDKSDDSFGTDSRCSCPDQ